MPTLFDTVREPDFVPHPKEPPKTGDDTLVAGLTHTAGQLFDLAGQVVRAAGPTALGLLRDPVGSLRTAVDTARSIAKTVAPVTGIRSPVMRARGLGRRLDVVAVALPDLKRAAKTAGVTVNNALLAGVAGGMRHYHHKHDAPVDELRVTMPISIRAATDALASNRITLMRFLVPVSEADPERRMRLIDASTRAVRDARSLQFTDAIAAGLDLLPTGIVGGMLKRVDFLASDVAGVRPRSTSPARPLEWLSDALPLSYAVDATTAVTRSAELTGTLARDLLVVAGSMQVPEARHPITR